MTTLAAVVTTIGAIFSASATVIAAYIAAKQAQVKRDLNGHADDLRVAIGMLAEARDDARRPAL